MNMADSPPLISIVIAVFNGKKTLQQCIDSIHEQSYENKELIVIDGGSTDGTLDLLRENAGKIDRWISEKDRGIYDAWNKGVRHASGQWISFLGADDYLWDVHVLERVATKLVALPPKVRYAYGEIMLINSVGENIHKVGMNWEKAGPRFKNAMSVTHPGSMHKRELFLEHGEFDENFVVAGDYEFLMRELKSNSAFFMPFLITGVRIDGISKNSNHVLRQLKEVRYAQKKHGFTFPSFTWMLAVSRVRLRLMLWKILGEETTRKALDIGRRMMGQEPYWTKHR